MPSPKPTGGFAGDHSSFPETRDCGASCQDCDEVDFTPYLEDTKSMEPDMFSDRSNCVCLIMHDADFWESVSYDGSGDYFEFLLNLTPWDF